MNRVNVPLAKLMYDGLDEFRVPPNLGVILQLGVVDGDASCRMDAQGLTRTLKLIRPHFALPIIIS
jgi:hypothetical protein